MPIIKRSESSVDGLVEDLNELRAKDISVDSDIDVLQAVDVDVIADIAELQAFDQTVASQAGNPILASQAGTGIRVDTLNPSFAWATLKGTMSTNVVGGGTPTLAPFRGGLCRRWFFAVNDTVDYEYCLPHDYLPGSDLFLQLHWGHNGTSISGDFVIQFSMTYTKSHNRGLFGVEKTFTLTIPATNLIVAPQYGGNLTEAQISAALPNASQLLSSQLEVDGEIVINIKVIGTPNITGGSRNTPFIGPVNLAYQTTGRGTKHRSPPFDN